MTNVDKKAADAIGGADAGSLWQKFMERDAHLDKLQEERANFWISQSGDAVKEKAALEKIEKELNPEIDKVAVEVKALLAAFHEAKGESSKELPLEGEIFVGDEDDEDLPLNSDALDDSTEEVN